MPVCTFYRDENNVDLGSILLEKCYLMDVYPSLLPSTTVGGLFTWGIPTCGRLGNNNLVSNVICPSQTAARGNNWSAVQTYSATNCSCSSAALKKDGTLWTWGANQWGQLGVNNLVNYSSPVQVGNNTNWRQVAMTQLTTGAVKTDGTLWMWGFNGYGTLGTSNQTAASSPVQVAGTNWKQVSVGIINHAAAIKNDGTLWTWGRNLNGVLGTNDQVNRSSPVQTVAGGTNWRAVQVGWGLVAALKTDGTLWTWGNGTCGGLGTGDVIPRSSPVQTISGGSNWCQISAGDLQVHAVKTDGTMWQWGFNANRTLGDGTNINRCSPVQSFILGTDWKRTIMGSYTKYSIKRDGTMWSNGTANCGASGQRGAYGFILCPCKSTFYNIKGWKDVAGNRYGGFGIIEINDW